MYHFICGNEGVCWLIKKDQNDLQRYQLGPPPPPALGFSDHGQSLP